MMPELYNDADFTKPPEFLDKELRDTLQVTLSEEHNAAKYVDTLVQIPLKTGENQWVLLHVEVQGEGGEDISYRMMLYCCLIFAHYRRMPVGLAILTDKRPDRETPGRFEFSSYGTELVYKYNLFEVYKQKDEQLLGSENPIDSFIYAAKKYGNYRTETLKLEYLLKLTRELHKKGLNERERAGILVLVTRLINLEDPELRKEYFKKLEGEGKMAELTWIEEHFMEEGLVKGLAQGRSEGRNEGIAIGEKRGEARGREQERTAIYEKLIATGMDRLEAASITGVALP